MSADRHPTKPPSGDSSLSWQIMHISYKIGYLQRTCDLILAAVTEKPTATRLPWHKIAELAMGTWRIFGPLVTHYLVPIIIAVLVWLGAVALGIWKWLLPYVLRLAGY